MKIRKIGYGFTKSLGNYENCHLHLEAELEDQEDIEASLNALRDRVTQELNLPDQWHDLKGKFARQLAALGKINANLEKAEQVWENFSEFLVGHGVDPATLTIENFAATRADHSADHSLANPDSDDKDDSDPYEYYPVDQVEEIIPIPF